MKVRMKIEDADDGRDKYIVEGKSWWFPFWVTKGLFIVDPDKNNKREVELEAVKFAEHLYHPVVWDI